MKGLRRQFSRLTSFARVRQDEERLQAEIEEHLALMTEEYIRTGLSPSEARRRAVLKFGGVEAVKEEYRDQRGMPVLESFVSDVRHTLRRLGKAPVFAATTILTLGIGIGATTSIFTLVHAVILKSLPVSNPNDLYRLGRDTHCCVWGGYTQYKEFSIVSDDLYRYFRDNTNGFEELAAFQAGAWPLGVRRVGDSQTARSYPGEFISGNYFKMFGVKAFAGRAIGESDDQPSAQPVAMMSYRLWQQQYGSSPSVIGSAFNLNDRPVTIVGITPPGFYGDTLRNTPPDFFIPIAAEPYVQGESSILHRADAHWLDLIGRVKHGADPASIEAQMRVELKQWIRSHWGEMDANDRARAPEQTLYLSPGGAGITSMREGYEHWLHILLMISGFVLMIVCANVANLMLVRGMERRQQTSLSVALGARPSRLVWQAMTESSILSLAGGVLGLIIAFAGTRLILLLAFDRAPDLGSVPIDAAPSMPVLLFALGISLLTGLVFGIAPAWFATRVDPIEALRGANRSTSRRDSIPRKALVVFQAALSLVLLSASGLLTAALRNLEHQDFGFEQDRRMVVNIDPRLAGYRRDQLENLYRRIHDSVASIPGVETVAMFGYSPQSGDSWNDTIFVDGHPVPGPKDDYSSSFERVTAGFSEAIGNPVLRGRTITERDIEKTTHVAVVNEEFVHRFFKNEDPIGKHFGRSELGATRLYEIVGVVKNARYLTYDLEKPIGPFFFVPVTQYDVFPRAEFTEGDVRSHFLHDVVAVAKPGATVTAADLRQAIARVDPAMPVNGVRTMRAQVASQFTQQRLIAQFTSFFGGLSLILASIGIYGVTAYNAGQRINEIGVRMALGADRGQVMKLILHGAFGLIAFGLLIGLPLTLAAGRFLGDSLYGISPYNAAVTSVAIMALGFSALAASMIPAFRASLISPLEALRSE